MVSHLIQFSSRDAINKFSHMHLHKSDTSQIKHMEDLYHLCQYRQTELTVSRADVCRFASSKSLIANRSITVGAGICRGPLLFANSTHFSFRNSHACLALARCARMAVGKESS